MCSLFAGQERSFFEIHVEQCLMMSCIYVNTPIVFSLIVLRLSCSLFSIMSEPKVILVSSDDEKFPVEPAVAEKSLLIKKMIEDLNPDGLEEDFEIPTPNVRSTVLAKVLEWCTHHKNTVFPEEEDDDARKSVPIDEWDKNFLKVDQEMIYEILLAANYLNIRPLLESGCKVVAEMIVGKSPEELRKAFNIVNDFTPEEEAAIRRENEWAEDR